CSPQSGKLWSVRKLVAEPDSPSRLRDKILDHRQVIPVHPVEEIVAVQPNAVDQTFLREPYPRAKIDDSVSSGLSFSLPQPRLACRQSQLDHSQVPVVL